MPSIGSGEEITRNLQEAIDELRLDLVRVELWAAALNGFQRPVPTYEPDNHLLLPPKQTGNLEKS
jgi:hypothetical protein